VQDADDLYYDFARQRMYVAGGVGALVSLYLAASRAKCLLDLANPKPRIRDLFELSKLTAVFESHVSGLDS
jgi:anti-anti-sigma regulatory factor